MRFLCLTRVIFRFALFASLVCVLSAAEEAFDPLTVQFATKPDHVILYIIDGLSYKTWGRIELPVLKKMIDSGVLVEKNYLPPSEHPTQGPYAELHSCSIPNPVLIAGTLFIGKETGYLPQSLFPQRTTAFIANTEIYSSLNRFYHYSYQKLGPDPEGIDIALEYMKIGRPAFMRLHLQEVGDASFQILNLKEDVPWRRNIWAKGSPYLKMLKQADDLLGRFVRGLKEQGILEKTALVIMGDHGEADTGYHPPEITDAAITSIILWGAGIKRGIKIPYSEHIDVVPTICTLLDAVPPRTCQGRPIVEALSQFKGQLPPRKMLFKKMLEQFEAYRVQTAEASWSLAHLESPEISRLYTEFENRRLDFYGIDRFTEWGRFKSTEELLENNGKALLAMGKFLEDVRKTKR